MESAAVPPHHPDEAISGHSGGEEETHGEITGARRRNYCK
jgi:hypothetical protein